MSQCVVAQLEEIEEMDDGRCPYRPVRHHLGITAFGAAAWTGREAGDRIINEHGELEPVANGGSAPALQPLGEGAGAHAPRFLHLIDNK